MRLEELRKKKGVTQKVVADAVFCSPTTYAKYERGVREPKIDTLRALSKFFGVTIDYIVCND